MGWEAANVHLGGAEPATLAAELRDAERAHGAGWLAEAAARMVEAVAEDCAAWRQTGAKSAGA